MGTGIIVVHDDPAFVDQVAAGLRTAGHDVTTFSDPLVAWDTMHTGRHFDVLITRIEFQPGRSNGVALANMARAKSPGIHVVFTALPHYAADAEGLGLFLPMPVDAADVSEAVRRLLED
jgi:DNA-binding NtrC family response regulator